MRARRPNRCNEKRKGRLKKKRANKPQFDLREGLFNNPAAIGTGLLPQDYPQGQVKYVDLDLRAMTSKFTLNITIPLKPFQGTLGLAPPDGYFPPLSPGVTNAVPPGPHAGNLDLSELSEGSTLYIP